MTPFCSQKGWWAFTSDIPEELQNTFDTDGIIFSNDWWTVSHKTLNQLPNGTVYKKNAVGFTEMSSYLELHVPSLVVTDVDSTLIDEEVIDELAEKAGCHDQVAQITERAMQGEMDFETSLHQRVALLKGLPADALHEVASQVTITSGGKELVDWVHQMGGKFGVVSGGFTQVVTKIVEPLGVDYVAAIELETVDGVLTGKTCGPIVNSQTKVEMLKLWSNNILETTVAIGDGANDIPMLQAAGTGIAFCAKPAVKKSTKSFLDIRNLEAVINLLGHTRVPR